MVLSDEKKLALAQRFLSVLRSPDPRAIKETAIRDVVWSFPGKGAISGEAVGVKPIIARAKIIAAFRLNVEVVHAVYSQYGIALILHNTATHGKVMFDEHIAAVFIFRGRQDRRGGHPSVGCGDGGRIFRQRKLAVLKVAATPKFSPCPSTSRQTVAFSMTKSFPVALIRRPEQLLTKPFVITVSIMAVRSSTSPSGAVAAEGVAVNAAQSSSHRLSAKRLP